MSDAMKCWLLSAVLAACGGDPKPAPSAPAPPVAAKPNVDPPVGHVAVVSAKPHDISTLTPETVVATIRAGIEGCYRAHLTKDASSSGNLHLEIRISENGRIREKVTASRYPADEVNACVNELAASWTFPAAIDPNGDPSMTDFTIELALTPKR